MLLTLTTAVGIIVSTLYSWRFGLVVTCWSRSIKLLYAGPG